MFAHSLDTRITLDCQVDYQENHDLPENDDTLSGTFQCHVGTSPTACCAFSVDFTPFSFNFYNVT